MQFLLGFSSLHGHTFLRGGFRIRKACYLQLLMLAASTTDFKTKMFVASKKFASARALLNTGVRARAAYELLEYS